MKTLLWVSFDVYPSLFTHFSNKRARNTRDLNISHDIFLAQIHQVYEGSAQKGSTTSSKKKSRKSKDVSIMAQEEEHTVSAYLCVIVHVYIYVYMYLFLMYMNPCIIEIEPVSWRWCRRKFRQSVPTYVSNSLCLLLCMCIIIYGHM